MLGRVETFEGGILAGRGRHETDALRIHATRPNILESQNQEDLQGLPNIPAANNPLACTAFYYCRPASISLSIRFLRLGCSLEYNAAHIDYMNPQRI